MLKKIIYIFLALYALIMFASVIRSGAVLAIVFGALIAGYVATMLISIKSMRKIKKMRERIVADSSWRPEKGDKILFHAMISNLPFYFIYFALSLIPMDFPALWIIAGLPCCVVAGLRPIYKNYQDYNYITNKGKLFWFLQIVLAVALWIIGRLIITYTVLGGI